MNSSIWEYKDFSYYLNKLQPYCVLQHALQIIVFTKQMFCCICNMPWTSSYIKNYKNISNETA